jgi:hypothetical protein
LPEYEHRAGNGKLRKILTAKGAKVRKVRNVFHCALCEAFAPFAVLLFQILFRLSAIWNGLIMRKLSDFIERKTGDIRNVGCFHVSFEHIPGDGNAFFGSTLGSTLSYAFGSGGMKFNKFVNRGLSFRLRITFARVRLWKAP